MRTAGRKPKPAAAGPDPRDVPALLITREGHDDWNVWITLPGCDALEDRFGFICGTGNTREQAVADAVRGLEDALERLQAPAGVIPERAI
jgi:hypothetical protein